jgi:four helix bundle protein
VLPIYERFGFCYRSYLGVGIGIEIGIEWTFMGFGQLLRASQAIPLNIAEGNGKATEGDRRRYFEIARGSALECGAIQDVLQVCGALGAQENARRKTTLDRIVAMLTKLGQRGYTIHEESQDYSVSRNDTDTDRDPDSDRSRK